MRFLKVVTLSTLMAATALAVTGCSSAQKGAAGAGLAGGIAGAVVGNNWVPVGPTTGAVIGGSSGAAVGGLVGDAYDQVTQADVERELENLRAQLAQKEEEMLALRNGAPSDQQLAELDTLRGQLKDLQDQLSTAQADASGKDALNADLTAARSEADALRDQLSQAQAEASALRTALGDTDSQLVNLKDRVNLLQTSLSERDQATEALRQQLADMQAQMAAMQAQMMEAPAPKPRGRKPKAEAVMLS